MSSFQRLRTRMQRYALAVDFGNPGNAGRQRDVGNKPLAFSSYAEFDISLRMRVNAFNRLKVTQIRSETDRAETNFARADASNEGLVCISWPGRPGMTF